MDIWLETVSGCQGKIAESKEGSVFFGVLKKADSVEYGVDGEKYGSHLIP